MLRESSPDMTSATMSVSAVPVPKLCKKYKKWTSVFMQFWVRIEMHCTQIVWKLYKMWMSVFRQFRVRIGIQIPRYPDCVRNIHVVNGRGYTLRVPIEMHCAIVSNW